MTVGEVTRYTVPAGPSDHDTDEPVELATRWTADLPTDEAHPTIARVIVLEREQATARAAHHSANYALNSYLASLYGARCARRAGGE